MPRRCLALALLLLAACGEPERATPARPVADAASWMNPFGAALRTPWTETDASRTAAATARAIDTAQQQFDDGLFDQARASIDALLGSGSGHPQVLFLAARLRVQAGAPAEALPWCERAIAAAPRWPPPRVLLAQCYLALERPAAAQSVFADFEQVAPWSPWGAYGQAAIAMRRGLPAMAQEHVARALAIDGRLTPALQLAAALTRLRNDAAGEEALLLRLVEVDPEHAPAAARLGALAAAGGRTADARRWLERAWDLSTDTSIAEQLAELARRRGDSADERRWMTAAGLRAP